jgi:hypothetical protein
MSKCASRFDSLEAVVPKFFSLRGLILGNVERQIAEGGWRGLAGWPTLSISTCKN